MNTFTVGPSQLFDWVGSACTEFVDSGLGAISHRSSRFRDLHLDTITNLKKLMNIPDEFGIFFSGSASEIWERILLQSVSKGSFHWVNGSFSKRFYEYAQMLHLPHQSIIKPNGQGFGIQDIPTDYSFDLFCITQNETSTGVATTADTIAAVKSKFPDCLLAVDMVSSAPIYIPDFELVDTAFFSVQKCFGLPAGLGVWIVSPTMLERSLEIAANRPIGAHHTLAVHWKNFKKNETHSTPNVLGIYLLNIACQKMLNSDWTHVSRRLEARALSLYAALEGQPKLYPAVSLPEIRSMTTLVLESPDTATMSEIKATLAQHQITVSSGYADAKDSQIRIANFPAISDIEFDSLSKLLIQISC